MAEPRYRPFLKAKQGEFGALATLDEAVRRVTIPVMEPLPDHAVDIVKFVNPMKKAWPSGLPFVLDFRLGAAAGGAAVSNAGEQLLDAGLNVIPAVGTGQDADYLRATADVAKRHKRGAAIRLSLEDIGDLDTLPDSLDALIRQLRRDPAEIDVLIDLYAFTVGQIGAMTTASIAALRSFPRVEEWRSITVVGTSFPENLSSLKPDSLTKVRRAEWEVWQRIAARTIPRKPDFGDYGIAHPELPEVDPRYMTMSANLRYTIDENWLVFKGRGVNKHGYEQFNAFCKKLVQMPEYSGEDFSWGDAAIKAHCRASSGPGNASVWRQIGTSHHVTFVARDLASLDES